MSEKQAKTFGETFIADLAAERDRIAHQFLVISAKKQETEHQMSAVGERLRQLLSAHGVEGNRLGTEVTLPAFLSKLTGRTDADGPPSHFELGLDALNSEIQGLNAEHVDQMRQLAELAGQSTALVRSNDHHETTKAAEEAHESENRTLAKFTAMAIAAASKGRPEIPSAGISTTAIRQLQGLDVEAGAKTITELFSMYCESHRSEWKNWDDRVKRDYNPIRDMLISLVGDRPIEELTPAHSRTFTEHMKAQAAAKGGKQTTVEKKVAFLSAVFSWGHEQTILPALTGPLKVTAEAESYEAYTAGELKLMFECEPYRANSFGRSSQFWLPLLGLYTAGRLDELASAKLEQISVVDGIDVIELSPGGKTTGKNNFSQRVIPLHRALVDSGLLTYVETLRREGFEDLFPCTPVATRDGRGKAASRDFQSFRRSLSIGAVINEGRGTKVFHSFRATLTTAMQSAGVNQEVREAITGHAKAGVHARVYSQGRLPLQQLVDALKLAVFDFEVPVWIDTPGYHYARKNGRAASTRKVRRE